MDRWCYKQQEAVLQLQQLKHKQDWAVVLVKCRKKRQGKILVGKQDCFFDILWSASGYETVNDVD